MGIRGLTTYIAKKSERYLERYELHDTYLVIDGNSLATQLYRYRAKCYDCFGGDYDCYAKSIEDFFKTLKQCNITALVIFDGCYENKKLRTIYGRVQNRVITAKKLNAYTESAMLHFPLFLRELFTDIVVSLGCKAIRCDFEADYEMACIARTLNCPVLSYDSDFFIFDVLYIPFDTIEFHPKRSNGGWVMNCRLYRIENFLRNFGGMDKANLPLLAVLLGNDYIKKSVFSGFYNHLKLVGKRKVGETDLSRRIESVIQWLRNETYESAARKVLGRIKLKSRRKVANQIKEVYDGYVCSESTVITLLELDLSKKKDANKYPSIEIDDVESIPDECEDDKSEESESDEFNINEEEEKPPFDALASYFPPKFLSTFRKCNYPAWFVEMALHNRYFCIPQGEDYSNSKHSHYGSLKLLAALHKILIGKKDLRLTCVARKYGDKIANTSLEPYTLEVPTLEELEDLDLKTTRVKLLQILELDTSLVDQILLNVNESWHLYVLSLIYWVVNSDKVVTNNYIYPIVLCGIILNDVDDRIGYHRTLSSLNRYETKNENDAESINFMHKMIPYFYMTEKMCRNPKIFDIHIVDSFNRFQSCFFHIKYVNKILNSPFIDVPVSRFYNGTFIYNMYSNLHKRSDSFIYLEHLLKDSTSIFGMFNEITRNVIGALKNVEIERKKRRFKAKKKKDEVDGESDLMDVDKADSSDGEFDESNPYSLLRKA